MTTGRIQRRGRRWTVGLLAVLSVVLLSRCDTVAPEEDALLVVEAFVSTDQPLPEIRLARTRAIDEPYADDVATAVSDARVHVQIGERRVPYAARTEAPGRYRSDDVAPVAARLPIRVEAEWQGRTVTAVSQAPPPIRLDDVRLAIPEEPVAGIILDSLFIDPARIDTVQTDTLRTGATEGFVYLVEVALAWTVDFDEVRADSAYWIRAQLRPDLGTTLDDFFFKPEQIFRERSLQDDTAGQRVWRGVYAVPVARATDPLPPHTVRAALIRSGQDYARFASSRDDPVRREPVSNVSGGIGIVAGLAVDTVRVAVTP